MMRPILLKRRNNDQYHELFVLCLTTVAWSNSGC